MVVRPLGNESSGLNRFTLVTPKSENDVRLQATLDNQNPTGKLVGVVRIVYLCEKQYLRRSPIIWASSCFLNL